MRSLLSRLLLIECCLLLLGGLPPLQARPGVTQNTEAQARALGSLIVTRLSLASDVAWVKFKKDLPVYDAAREKELLAALVKQGEEKGVPAAWVERFFAAQMAASRSVQQELIDGWKQGKPQPQSPPLDLQTAIRPKLNAVSAEMIEAIRPFEKGGFPAADLIGVEKSLEAGHIPAAAIKEALQPLR